MAIYDESNQLLPWEPRIETLAIHGGQSHDAQTGAVMPSISVSTTYAQESPGNHKGFEYSRTQNPTRFALERALASIEHGRFGLAFASGCAAATTILQTLDAGDHVVSGDDLYGGTFRLFEKVMSRRGQSFTYVDTKSTEAIEAAILPETKMVWLESPTNPLLKLADIEAISTICRKRGVTLVVDNTFASPFFQTPLDLGADLVLHSTTKYIGGHSDVVGGAIIARDEHLYERLAFLQNTCGAVPSPFDCYMTLRGIKTLPLRMARHGENGMAIASFLSEQKPVRKVLYPGLSSHPQHSLASSQMRGSGGMLSFYLDTDMAGTNRFFAALQIFTLAESLGGVESLIEHPAMMTHASVPVDRRRELGIDDGLVRLSAGIEHIEDLISDLERGLQAI